MAVPVQADTLDKFEYLFYKHVSKPTPTHMIPIGHATIFVMGEPQTDFTFMISDLVNYLWHGLDIKDRTVISAPGL